MQISMRVVKPILISIISLFFLVTFVCGLELTSTPTISGNITLLTQSSSTTFSTSGQTQINSSEKSMKTPRSPAVTSVPSPKSTDNLKKNGRQRLAPINPDFIAYQQNVTTKTAGLNRILLQASGNQQNGLGFIPPIMIGRAHV